MSDRFSLDSVIVGLANDLDELRAGRISTADAQARALLARQIFNGVRLVLNGRQFLEADARPVNTIEAAP